MNALRREREARKMSKAEVARASGLNESTYGQIENRRFQPYPGQLSRIAKALEWRGDPKELLEEVDGEGS